MFFFRAEIREEIHFHGCGKPRGGAKRDVHILMQDFCDIRPRNFHPRCKFRLRHSQLLHPQEDPAEKCRADSIYDVHFALRSASCGREEVRAAPVEYARKLHNLPFLKAKTCRHALHFRQCIQHGQYFNILVNWLSRGHDRLELAVGSLQLAVSK